MCCVLFGLAEFVEMAALVCRAAASSKFGTSAELRSICACLGLLQAQSAAVEMILHAGAEGAVG
jgi:hypothetical protein